MKLTPFEVEVMEALWADAPASIREVHEKLARGRELAYTTVQTIVSRLEAKGAVRRVRKVGNAHLFAPTVTRGAVRRRLVDDFLGLLGGARPLMLHLAETGKLSLEDLQAIESAVKAQAPSKRKK
jgi:BlaI family penicillinase repressor